MDVEGSSVCFVLGVGGTTWCSDDFAYLLRFEDGSVQMIQDRQSWACSVRQTGSPVARDRLSARYYPRFL